MKANPAIMKAAAQFVADWPTITPCRSPPRSQISGIHIGRLTLAQGTDPVPLTGMSYALLHQIWPIRARHAASTADLRTAHSGGYSRVSAGDFRPSLVTRRGVADCRRSLGPLLLVSPCGTRGKVL
jgi:hypothetical protein